MPRYETTTAEVIATHIGNMVGGSGTISFRPVVTYRYTVDGETYTNDQYSQRMVGQRNRRAIQRVLDKYPPGSIIEIYYRTRNPADSFIKKGYPAGAAFMMTFILLAALLTLFLIVGPRLELFELPSIFNLR